MTTNKLPQERPIERHIHVRQRESRLFPNPAGIDLLLVLTSDPWSQHYQVLCTYTHSSVYWDWLSNDSAVEGRGVWDTPYAVDSKDHCKAKEMMSPRTSPAAALFKA